MTTTSLDNKRETVHAMRAYIAEPARELAGLVEHMDYILQTFRHDDKPAYLRNLATDLRATVPAICEALDAFAEELEMSR